MNAPSGMTCESCRELLIELACDELPADTAAEVRAHALRCERCGPELEKLGATLRLSRELPLLTPSPEVERRVMQAARDAIARRARGPAREASVPTGGGLTAWFARLGSFAMSPQVAMASVLLLVVGIGLYTVLPLGHAPESTALRVAEDEAPAEEHAPPASPAASATAVPLSEPGTNAVPADDVNGWAEREEKRARAAMDKASVPAKALESAKASRAKESSVPKAFPESQAAPIPAQSKARASKPSSAGSKGTSLEDPFGDGLGSVGRAAGGGGVAAEPTKKAPTARDEGAASNRGQAAQAPYAPAPPAAAPAPVAKRKSADSEILADRAAEAEAPAPVAASAPSGASTQRAAPAKKEQDASSTALSQGIAAARRGEHVLAQQLLQPLLSSSNPRERDEARLWLARSLRERGDCARALEHYRVLTQSVTAPRSVLEEAADCQERLGNSAAASKLRSRAALPAEKK